MTPTISTDQCGVHGVLEHWVDEDGEPVGEDEVGDEESPAHRPQQQQDVERLEGSLTIDIDVTREARGSY